MVFQRAVRLPWISISDMRIEVIDDPFDLAPLAASIRRSSNFRFAWQFLAVHADDLQSVGTVAAVLDAMIRTPALHSFLIETMDDIYPRKFEIEPLHCHASIVADKSCFLDTITRASLDRLGAYSRELDASTAGEREPIHKLFSSAGRYFAYTIRPGARPDCDVCQHHNSHLFSNWFFDVAWDYTFMLTWPLASLFWIGCLTDTD